MQSGLPLARIEFDVEGNLVHMIFHPKVHVSGYEVAIFIEQYIANRRYLHEQFWDMQHPESKEKTEGKSNDPLDNLSNL